MKTFSFKKVLAVIAAVVIPLSASLVAFAAPNPSVEVPGNTVVINAVDTNGNTVNAGTNRVENAGLTDAQVKDIYNIKSTDGLKNAMGTDYTSSMVVSDVTYVGFPNGTAFPVTVTLSVPGVKAGDKVFVYIYDEATGSWSKVSATAGDGVVTFLMNSDGVVSVVVDKNAGGTLTGSTTTGGSSTTGSKTTTAASGTTATSGKTTPLTGDNTSIALYVILGAGALFVMGVVGISAAKKKKVK